MKRYLNDINDVFIWKLRAEWAEKECENNHPKINKNDKTIILTNTRNN